MRDGERMVRDRVQFIQSFDPHSLTMIVPSVSSTAFQRSEYLSSVKVDPSATQWTQRLLNAPKASFFDGSSLAWQFFHLVSFVELDSNKERVCLEQALRKERA